MLYFEYDFILTVKNVGRSSIINMCNSFYSEEELKEIGFASIGENVLVSRKASLYEPNKISLGNHVRIDDFCVLSGKIKLGNYIHIAVHSVLFGGSAGIVMDDFSGLSSRCAIYATSDDFSGEVMTNPTVPKKYTRNVEKAVILHKHVIIGSGTTILPGVNIDEGVAVGSMSLVNKSLKAWGIYIGNPCRKIKDRSRKLLEMEEELIYGKV